MAYCGSCGSNKGESAVCPNCGVGGGATTPPPAPQQGWQQPAGYTQNVYVQNVGTNGMAIASLVCAFLCTPLAVIFGHIALSQIGKSGQGGRGLAIAGLVIGYISIAIGILIFVAAAGSGY